MIDYDISMPVVKNKNGKIVCISEINDSNKNEEYFCLACGTAAKPRAIHEDNKVQSHFYHVCATDCNSETIFHKAYKDWLFEKGKDFILDFQGNLENYKVKDIDIEKTYNTKFGVYRPDITVITVCGKTIFFEVNYSNKKDSSEYFEKWQELNNDVVEIDVKKLYKLNYTDETPQFDVIYCNGVCASKYEKQSRKSTYYNTIGQYKNRYKNFIEKTKQIEMLDWFWVELQKYKKNLASTIDVIKQFRYLDIEDQFLCHDIVKRIKCVNLKNQFEDIFKEELFGYLNDMFKYYYECYSDINFEIQRTYNVYDVKLFSVEYRNLFSNNCMSLLSINIPRDKITYDNFLFITNEFIDGVFDHKFKYRYKYVTDKIQEHIQTEKEWDIKIEDYFSSYKLKASQKVFLNYFNRSDFIRNYYFFDRYKEDYEQVCAYIYGLSNINNLYDYLSGKIDITSIIPKIFSNIVSNDLCLYRENKLIQDYSKKYTNKTLYKKEVYSKLIVLHNRNFKHLSEEELIKAIDRDAEREFNIIRKHKRQQKEVVKAYKDFMDSELFLIFEEDNINLDNQDYIRLDDFYISKYYFLNILPLKFMNNNNIFIIPEYRNIPYRIKNEKDIIIKLFKSIGFTNLKLISNVGGLPIE